MVTTEDLARMNRLSVAALELYREIGIFQKDKTDLQTGYGYCSAQQIIKLKQISALEAAGFSLAEIADIFQKETSHNECCRLLEDKALQLEEAIRVQQERLIQLRNDIFLIKNGELPLVNEVIVKKVEPILVASLRVKISGLEEMGSLWRKLNQYIDEKKVKKITPSIVLYYNDAGIGWNPRFKNDIAIIEPVATYFPGNAQIKVYELEAVDKIASIVHNGPFETIHQTYAALSRWIKENGFTKNGPVREIYHTGEWVTYNLDQFITEIQVPIK